MHIRLLQKIQSHKSSLIYSFQHHIHIIVFVLCWIASSFYFKSIFPSCYQYSMSFGQPLLFIITANSPLINSIPTILGSISFPFYQHIRSLMTGFFLQHLLSILTGYSPVIKRIQSHLGGLFFSFKQHIHLVLAIFDFLWTHH